jgi:putative tryptophan/tyrosine transport system substrate-binding protein
VLLRRSRRLAICRGVEDSRELGISVVGTLPTELHRAFHICSTRLLPGFANLVIVESQTMTIEWKFAEQRYERLPELASELVRLGVDVIFATADQTAAAAKQATKTIPIVFNAAADPVASGFALSLSHPSGNMTGLAQPGPQATGKRLSFLKEAVPKLTSVGILLNHTALTMLNICPSRRNQP